MSAVDPAVLRAAIGECVTVVGPDEVLAVRVPPDLTGQELKRLRDQAEDANELIGIRIVFVAGDDWARIRRDQVPGGGEHEQGGS